MAMLTSGEYNLTKKNVAPEKKSMFFIKLTDSAHRALDAYFRDLSLNSDAKPQIEFNDKTEGRILIPTKKNANSDKCVTQFKFDVTSNVAMQGTQGRFDCVQHKRNSKQLLKWGQLSQRLRIHANEDVYETTKNRMAAIELEQRKNCTRQLDWNSTHMSRKTKLDKIAKPSTTSTPPPLAKSEEKETSKSTAVELSNVVRSKTRSVYNPPQKMNTNVYKVRKPLRERIVQMLALRPYKKGELQAVLKQEGVRDCDKPHLTDTLSSVSTLRDNVYHLAKSAWHDVQEDWLFYTEQEKQIVLKNKLRNLTSPSSSDSGISTSSNQSPSNTPDEKSPPSNYKRPGYINNIDGFPTKRQRISHYSRQEPAISSTKSSTNSSSTSSAYDENNAPRCGGAGGGGAVDDHHLRPSSARNQQRSSAPPSQPQPPPSSVSECASAGDTTTTTTTTTTANNYSATTYRKDTPPPVVSSTTEDDDSPRNENCIEDECNEVSSTRPPLSSQSVATHHVRPQPPPPPPVLRNGCDRDLQFRKLVKPEPVSQKPLEKPKYLKEYFTVTNSEQRRRYKADFNRIFDEYKSLHEEMDGVSNDFARLGESLRQHKKGSPKYNKIESEIFKKYYAVKKSEKFTQAKRRFEYLHEKLSHIKQLVHEYDAKNHAH